MLVAFLRPKIALLSDLRGNIILLKATQLPYCITTQGQFCNDDCKATGIKITPLQHAYMWAITVIKLAGPAEEEASVPAGLGVLLEACWAGAIGAALAGKELLCFLIAEAAGVLLLACLHQRAFKRSNPARFMSHASL